LITEIERELISQCALRRERVSADRGIHMKSSSFRLRLIFGEGGSILIRFMFPQEHSQYGKETVKRERSGAEEALWDLDILAK
jgi:hypothetical protein